MITHEKITELVGGIAAKFSFNQNTGQFDTETFEDYKQELFLEAYTLLNKNPNVHINWLAKSLWNRAKEVFNEIRDKQGLESSTSHFTLETSELASTQIVDAHIKSSSINPIAQDSKIKEVVDIIIEYLPEHSENLITFMIAKLKLSGYLPEDYRPDILVDVAKINEQDASENAYILGQILHLNNAPSGGPNAFKNEKRKLFLKLISILELDDIYKRWYELKYVDHSNNVVVTKIKDYSAAAIEKQVHHAGDAQKIIHIIAAE